MGRLRPNMKDETGKQPDASAGCAFIFVFGSIALGALYESVYSLVELIISRCG